MIAISPGDRRFESPSLQQKDGLRRRGPWPMQLYAGGLPYRILDAQFTSNRPPGSRRRLVLPGPRLPPSGTRIQASDELLFLLVGVREDHCAFEPNP
jgi:hypothetical protein